VSVFLDTSALLAVLDADDRVHAKAKKVWKDLVGRAGIINPAEWPGPEVGYLLGRSWWGQGYATEAARAAMEWGFREVGFDELISLIDPDNTASIAVATRLGETLRDEIELWGHRVRRYAITRQTWQTQVAG